MNTTPQTTKKSVKSLNQRNPWFRRLLTFYISLLTVMFAQNYSLSFDGVDDYVDLHGNSTFNFGNSDFTVSLWFKSLTNEIPNTYVRPLIKDPITVPDGYYDLFAYSDGFSVYGTEYSSEACAIFHWDTMNHPGWYGTITNINLIDENWHYITGVKQGTNLYIYIDGELTSFQVRTPPENQNADNDGPLIIGSNNNTIPHLIYSPEIWNRALSQEEIQTNMTSILTGNEDGLIGFWEFNGNSLIDLTENGNDGTIFEALWSTDSPFLAGCTDPLATNYNEDADFDDGSCTYTEPTYYSLHFDYMSGYALSEATSESIFQGVTSFTVEIWYKNPGVANGPNSGLPGNANIVTNYRRMGGGDPYNNFDLSMSSPIALNPGYVTFLGTTSNELLDDNEWHHIAGIYDNVDGMAHLFIDGEIHDSNEISGDFLSSYNKLYLNNHAPFAGEYHMECGLAGLRVSNGIKYESNFTPNFPLDNEDNSIISLDFSLGSGTNINDLSGNGHHFTSAGSTSWSTDVPALAPPTPGCTDPLAENYNEEANVDDGSCTYPDNGDYSLSFDGVDDWIEMENSILMDNSTELSIIALILIRDYDRRNVILEKHTSTYGGLHPEATGWYFYRSEDNKLTFSGNSDVGFSCQSTIELPINEIVEVAAIYGDNNCRVFINGIDYTDIPVSDSYGELKLNTENIAIGIGRWGVASQMLWDKKV